METTQTLLIAEAGVNHNGSLDTALALVDAAAEAGADVVKFQTFRSELLSTDAAPKAAYQVRTTGEGESQLAMLKKLELAEAHHEPLMRRCADRGIRFLSTPGDPVSFRFLHETLGLDLVKLGSGELTNAPMLLDVARSGKPILLSTGMGTLGEIEEALGVLAFGISASNERPSREAFREAYRDPARRGTLRGRVTLLHCTSEYPAAVEEVNLRVIQTLRSAFELPVGYSDHTEGIAVSIAAVAMGATVIEKHFTLDRAMPGPDHAASLEPSEFAALAAGVRQVERALGGGQKVPSAIERQNSRIGRRSLVASRDLSRGELLSEENLAVKRPGSGITAMAYFDVLGRPAPQDLKAGELLREER